MVKLLMIVTIMLTEILDENNKSNNENIDD
jgi:hypothetical protein